MKIKGLIKEQFIEIACDVWEEVGRNYRPEINYSRKDLREMFKDELKCWPFFKTYTNDEECLRKKIKDVMSEEIFKNTNIREIVAKVVLATKSKNSAAILRNLPLVIKLLTPYLLFFLAYIIYKK